jgi:hypothetical protein
METSDYGPRANFDGRAVARRSMHASHEAAQPGASASGAVSTFGLETERIVKSESSIESTVDSTLNNIGDVTYLIPTKPSPNLNFKSLV